MKSQREIIVDVHVVSRWVCQQAAIVVVVVVVVVIVWAIAYTNGEFDVPNQYHMTRHAT